MLTPICRWSNARHNATKHSSFLKLNPTPTWAAEEQLGRGGGKVFCLGHTESFVAIGVIDFPFVLVDNLFIFVCGQPVKYGSGAILERKGDDWTNYSKSEQLPRTDTFLVEKKKRKNIF